MSFKINQKLKYFNGTANFTFFNTPLPPKTTAFPKILDLCLNDD